MDNINLDRHSIDAHISRINIMFFWADRERTINPTIKGNEMFWQMENVFNSFSRIMNDIKDSDLSNTQKKDCLIKAQLQMSNFMTKSEALNKKDHLVKEAFSHTNDKTMFVLEYMLCYLSLMIDSIKEEE